MAITRLSLVGLIFFVSYASAVPVDEKVKRGLIDNLIETRESWVVHIDSRKTAKRIGSLEMSQQVEENMRKLVIRKRSLLAYLKKVDKDLFTIFNLVPVVSKYMLDHINQKACVQDTFEPQLKKQKTL